MFKYYLMIGCLLLLTVACSPTPSDTTVAESVEDGGAAGDGDSHNEEADRDDDHGAESGRGEDREGVHDDHRDDHVGEDDHGDDHGDVHDDHRDDHVGEDDHDHGHGDEDSAQRGHGAHQHGRATLTIAWSGADLAIDLQTPAYNILGFEYAPVTDAEKRLLAESITTLQTGELMRLTPEAECAMVAADVETALAGTERGAEGGHEEEGGTHADFDVFYTVQCEKPDALAAVDASGLFAAFANFAAIQVQWVSDSGQSAKTLTAADAILSFD